MARVRVELADAMETSLITLYGKALDAQRNPTILGDTMAVQAVDRIDYDFARLKKMGEKVAPNVATRAKHFDDWAREFLAGHERATVVHLGAGLDTRVWRVDPGPGIAWYDIDYPDVVDVRSRIFPEREHYRMIGSSVTEARWLEQVPADRPTFVLAEGLTMYLRPEQGHELFHRITHHFSRGTIAFDTHNRLAVWAMNRFLARKVGAPPLHWAINDPRELERRNPRLRCTDAVNALAAPSSAALPLDARVFGKLTRPVPALRDLSLYLRYEFGE